ncbi:hypothetical protein EDC22_101330 [Tepidamorphus gemmatus]|uniref:Uncharacterized protein n=1 Tax=Tepidamorphus gemmatus TaxID=747076 RepID=A0A4R3MJE8_9HYPH|nr:hypothetical protein EDC22_101330 [Tepidamorphus gemmatus]
MRMVAVADLPDHTCRVIAAGRSKTLDWNAVAVVFARSRIGLSAVRGDADWDERNISDGCP